MLSESFLFFKRVLIFHSLCPKNGSKVDGRELPQGCKARSFLMSASCWELCFPILLFLLNTFSHFSIYLHFYHLEYFCIMSLVTLSHALALEFQLSLASQLLKVKQKPQTAKIHRSCFSYSYIVACYLLVPSNQLYPVFD